MADTQALVVFMVDEQQFALNLTSVERIVRAVEITHVPGAPDTILGVINLEGRIVPVVDSRRRLGMPERDIQLEDLFIIVTEHHRTAALVGDEVKPVMQVSANEMVSSDRIISGENARFDGVAKVADEMIMVLTLDNVLSGDEDRRVEAAIRQLPEIDA